MKNKIFQLLLILISLIFFQCNQKEEQTESAVTFICDFYDINTIDKKIYLRIYDKNDNFICDTKTNEEGKANINLKTKEIYYVDGYGFDDEGYYINGSSYFEVSPDKLNTIIEITMKYTSMY